MAYVNLLSNSDFAFELLEFGTSLLIQAVIGCDDAVDISYSLHISLDVLPGGSEHELRFCLNEYDGSTDSDFSYFSAKDAAMKIPQRYKSITRACLLHGIETLITKGQPAMVFLCTYDRYAPPKANRKFALIAELFERKGYEVRTADPYNGQRVWWMIRSGRPEGNRGSSKDQDHGS